MKVWIDHDQCVGAGTCADLAPSVFFLAADGLAYTKDVGEPRQVRGRAGEVPVPLGAEDEVLDAAEDCPAECIIIEMDDATT